MDAVYADVVKTVLFNIGFIIYDQILRCDFIIIKSKVGFDGDKKNHHHDFVRGREREREERERARQAGREKPSTWNEIDHFPNHKVFV